MDNFLKLMRRRRRRIGSLRTLVFMFQNNSPSQTSLKASGLEFLKQGRASLRGFFIHSHVPPLPIESIEFIMHYRCAILDLVHDNHFRVHYQK